MNATHLNDTAWTDVTMRSAEESATPLARPSLDGVVHADVCVVGLGGSGLACIGELLTLGARVVGVDGGVVGGGAAGRNGGFLLAGTAAFYNTAVAMLGRERARAVYQRTLDELDRIATETPRVVRRTGSVRLADTAEELSDCTAELHALHADGFPAAPYEGPDGRGLLIPTDGRFNPLHRCRILAHRARQAGARLYERSCVTALAPGVVRTERGEVQCGVTIVAVDGGLERLLPELEGRVRTARLQMLGTAPAPEVTIPRPMYSRWGYDYWQQLEDGRVVVGGGRDHFEGAEWTASDVPSAEVQRYLEGLLRERIGVRAPITHRWAASVAYARGLLPVLAEVRPRVWAIGGYSGTGNVMGAVLGRAVAQLAVRGESALAVPFRAEACASA